MHKKILFLDGLRGIAALYVLIGHARWLLWEGYENGYKLHPEKYNSLDKCLMYLFAGFKYGHEFVLFFFVLSGFVIHLNYARKLRANPNDFRFDFKAYFLKRFKRIYPPFVFAILLTFILDFIGRNNGFTIYQSKTPYPLINESLGNRSYSVSTLFGNVLFLFKAYVPIFGMNGPAWSLKFEWWFYMLYPLFLLMSRKHIFYATASIILLFILSFFPSFWPSALLMDIFSMMISWWLGVLLAEIIAQRIKINLILFGVTCFVIKIFFVGLKLKNNIIIDFGTAFLFVGIVSLLLYINENKLRLTFLERLKILGDFSYTLYITHFPIVVLFSGILMSQNNGYLPHHSYWVIAGILLCVSFAYFVHFFTELPFIRNNSNSIRKLQ